MDMFNIKKNNRNWISKSVISQCKLGTAFVQQIFTLSLKADKKSKIITSCVEVTIINIHQTKPTRMANMKVRKYF